MFLTYTSPPPATATPIRPAKGDSAMPAPAAVASPAPPLNRRNNGYQCPSTAAAPATAASSAGNPKNPARATARMPFKPSPRKTNTPKRRLTVRNTFAAPGLRVPTSRMSTPRIRVSRTAMGSDPRRYPMTTDAIRVPMPDASPGSTPLNFLTQALAVIRDSTKSNYKRCWKS